MQPLILLSGGLATRMRPMTETVPKAMLTVAEKPFIHHQLTMLASRGIERVIMCVGYLGEMIQDYVGDGSRYGLTVQYSYDGKKLLGTGGAIKKAYNLIQSDSFFTLYGDSYLDIEYKDVAQSFDRSGASGLMTVYKNHNQWDASNVIFEGGRLIKYSKSDKSARMNYIDYGLCVLKTSMFDRIEADAVCDLASVLEELSFCGQLAGYEVFNRFYEIGSLEGLLELEKLLRKE